MTILKKNINIILTLLFVSGLASGGIFVKLSELGPINTGFYRILFSVPILYIALFFFSKNEKLLTLKEKLTIILAGSFLAGDLILWNISFHYTTVANANLLANMVPFIIVPVSYFFFREKISTRFFFSLLVTLVGVFILIEGKENAISGNAYGNVLAFITSIFYATFLLIVYKVRSKASALQIMYYSSFGALPILFIAALSNEGISYPRNTSELLPLLGLAIFSQILGQGGLSYILGKISANIASVLVLTQPVISAIFSYFIFREILSTMEMVGVFIVLLGIFLIKKK
ncbi:DMT family transporter [Xenorhabdus innexi]|uniref:EamA domain-containing protein n=1 Tax=Xenorhabdus innexi TaxID=290109 RepID=A0A1N6MUC5_9GAMM|nr:DMT family transporter [Xenorhabdus innexi]PHM30224.1 hypothetical protein Xinn_03410 [Xenorhabdus innexi]SIP72456.1 conserved membrane hypothetical protein [Xenorhabdus innexi]